MGEVTVEMNEEEVVMAVVMMGTEEEEEVMEVGEVVTEANEVLLRGSQ